MEKSTVEKYYQGKICIVTGGSTGIGYGLGVRLLEHGAAAVWFVARTQSKLDEDAVELKQYVDEGRAFFKAVDCSVCEEVEALIKEVKEKHGRIDFLFNNAGIGSGGQTERASIHAWEKIIQTNLWSVIYGVHAVLPIMIEQQSGHIVNTSSIQGLIPAPFQTLYATSKHAIVGLSESLHYEMVPNGIACSVLCPGAVASEIFHKGGQETPATAISIYESADWALERIADQQVVIPVAQLAQDRYDKYRFKYDDYNKDLLEKADKAKQCTDIHDRLGCFLGKL